MSFLPVWRRWLAVLERRFRLGILVVPFAFGSLAVGGAVPAGAAAPSVGEPFELLPPSLGDQQEPRIVAHELGYALAWLWDAGSGLPLPQPGIGALVLLGPDGEVFSDVSFIGAVPGGPAVEGRLTGLDLEVDGDGELLVGVADELLVPFRHRRPLYQRFSGVPAPLGPVESAFEDALSLGILDLDFALAGNGRSILAVDAAGDPVPTFFRRVLGQIRGPGDALLRSDFLLDETPVFTDHADPAVAAGADGRFVLAYEDDLPEGFGGRLTLRRFDRDGEPVGSEIIASPLARAAQEMLVELAPDGHVAVAWGEEIAFLGGTTTVGYRTYDPEDQPLTEPLDLTETAGPPQEESLRRELSMSMDSRGGALVLWLREDSDGTRALEGRFVNHRGVPQGEIVEFASGEGVFSAGSAALRDDGGGLLVWARPADRRLFGRPFAAPRDDELCVNRGPELSCDTANDGGDFEETVRFGLGPEAGDLPLMGDIDGDGDDDLCLRRNAVFLCDADGRGAPAELRQRFGRREHGALLGDLDGDGDDDPCLRIRRRLVCDTGHDGPPAEYRQLFGAVGEDLILGDVDGDGRDEACVYRGRRFRCDPEHRGSPASFVSAPLGSGQGTPLLGDIDGDGRDDLCVLEGSELICDVARDGSPPISRALVLEPGDLPVMGNLDGF